MTKRSAVLRPVALFAAALLGMGILSTWRALAQGAAPEACEVPGYLLFGDSELKRVAEAAEREHRINILVVGTASSTLSGSNGAAAAYPERLAAVLQRRLPGLEINVISEAKPRQTAADMAQNLKKILRGTKPVLVIWQSGTVDAMRGVDPEKFRAALDAGVETLQGAGADVILMNMQYSPRTESMIALGSYADSMRAIARERNVPLFDRFAIMRQWSDMGAFDLGAANDPAMAPKVHDCIARALASVIIDAAHLEKLEAKAPQ